MSSAVHSGFELDGEPSKLKPMLRDLWASRKLLRMLAKKTFLVQYRRASLGMLWAIGLPLIQALVMVAVIGRIVRFDTSGAPFSAYVLAAIVPWTFFMTAIQASTTSIVEGSSLATKVYFPRAIFPIVMVLAGVRGLVPGLAIMLGVAAILGASMGVAALMIIPATLLMLTLATGFSLVFAALHVYFRDMRFIVSAATLPWFWASGVFYPVTVFKSFRRWIELNPAVGMLELFRSSIDAATPGWERSAVITAIWAVALMLLALPLYRRYDRVFVDLL
ncbi:MAG: ABC transporter permease [Actinomycetota bacterium]